ncbi:cation transporter [Pimelobacter simplex]|uniref:cation transporter n=1 Tax=Nocardioides simplex TaxID=2045 RepID=UPI0027E21AB5|nr:cation transporter [Pimelobacter simplex]
MTTAGSPNAGVTGSSATGSGVTGRGAWAALDADRRRRLMRRAQLLAAASVTYNVIEAVIAVTAGLVAGSVALVGFGLDSVVEVSSGLVILWQFRHPLPESRERQALRLMALSFFALAGYVTFESLRALVGGNAPDTSTVGIALAALSLAIMPFLSWAQRRTGRELGSDAVVADSTQTLLCTYLSAVLLAGLLLNALLGWSWADPLAGLMIAAVALREGVEAWRGEGCACGPAHTGEPPAAHPAHPAHPAAASAPQDAPVDDGCGTSCCQPASTVPLTLGRSGD